MRRLFMKKLKPILFSLIFVLFISAFVGCGEKSSPKTFEKLEMQITLTDEFVEKSHISHTVYYEASDKIVTALREDFNLFPSGYTLTDYAEAVINNNNLENVRVYTSRTHGYVYFSYEKELNDQNYYYFATCHTSDTAFWLIQFGCFEEDKNEFLEEFKTYAGSVDFEIQATSSSSSRSRRSSRSGSEQSSSSSVNSSSSTSIIPSSITAEEVMGIYKYYGMIIDGETILVTDPESIEAGLTPDLYVFDLKENNQLSANVMTFQYTGTWYISNNYVYLVVDGEPLEASISGDLLYWIDEEGDTLLLSKTAWQNSSSSITVSTSISSGYQEF